MQRHAQKADTTETPTLPKDLTEALLFLFSKLIPKTLVHACAFVVAVNAFCEAFRIVLVLLINKLFFIFLNLN